jgi:hypothetical protein
MSPVIFAALLTAIVFVAAFLFCEWFARRYSTDRAHYDSLTWLARGSRVYQRRHRPERQERGSPQTRPG